MSADILERLEARAYSIELAGYHQSAADMREAAAEIVRLRGEVARLRVGDCRLINGEWWTCNDPADGKFVRFQGSHHPVIAPAEAKVEVPGDGWPLRYTTQPAGGEAVAWQWRLHGVDTDLEWVTRNKRLPDSITSDPACEVRALYTHPPAAQVQQEVALPWGYLVDGVPFKGVASCDKTAVPLYTHPAGDALGAVQDALEAAARSLRTIAEQAGKTEGMDDMMNVRGYANSRANVAEAALQHRGDSRGGEGSDA